VFSLIDSRDLKPLVKCFISIGTGNLGIKPFEEGIFEFLKEAVVGIVTENRGYREEVHSKEEEAFRRESVLSIQR
jgi:hypothetical protein